MTKYDSQDRRSSILNKYEKYKGLDNDSQFLNKLLYCLDN